MSVTGISSAMTVGFNRDGTGKYGLGERFGPLGAAPVVLVGSALLAASLALFQPCAIADRINSFGYRAEVPARRYSRR